ncbi:MAG: hypothetical protein ACI4TB_10150 [Lachnospiraceae bacterium]
MLAFLIWLFLGVAFIGMGIYDYHSKKEKPFGFWANAETVPMEDVRGYNKALGKLWCVFGAVFVLLGVPLLAGQNSPYVLLSVVGAMLECIVAMAVYTIKIEGKYRKR